MGHRHQAGWFLLAPPYQVCEGICSAGGGCTGGVAAELVRTFLSWGAFLPEVGIDVGQRPWVWCMLSRSMASSAPNACWFRALSARPACASMPVTFVCVATFAIPGLVPTVCTLRASLAKHCRVWVAAGLILAMMCLPLQRKERVLSRSRGHNRASRQLGMPLVLLL